MDRIELANALVALAGVVVSVIVSCVAIYVSFLAAKKYGDVAGTRAGIEYEKKKATGARVTAIKALLNEVARVRKLADSNSRLDASGLGMVKMPTGAFETAFVSKSSLSVSEELLNAALGYLAQADLINSLIDEHRSLAPAIGTSRSALDQRTDITRRVPDESKELFKILDQLEDLLKRE